ncbi:MAG: hypothetical protein QXG00_02435, partial [Candidatus Woesearchaeota archaeon]
MNLTNSKNILIIIAVFILCAFFVISFHTTTITTNPPFSNTREKIINFTISNSAGTGNLTYFNISSINQTAFNATFKHVINNNSDTNCILDSDFLVNCTMVSNLSPSTSTWVEINISTSTDGNYSFMIESVDDASEINQTIVNYIFDTINPSINIVSPTPGQLFTTSTVFYMLTSDEVLSSCVFSINDWSTNFSMVLNATGKEANFTNTSVSDGSYTALYWCNDTANNINDTQTVAFIVDATSPTINLIMTANGTVSNNTTPTLSFNITDNYDTMLNYSVYINGVVNSTGNISNNTQQTIHISSLNDGFYSFNIETFDDAEHYVNSTILYLTIDTSPPVYNLSGISTSTSTKGSIVYIWAKFWDAVSDIDTVWLYSENNLNQTNASHNLNFSLVNFSYTVPDDVDGATLNFTIYANDSVGYTANTSIITLYVNDTPPTISINKPDNIETVAHFNISLNTSSDANICLINAIWIDDAGGSDELLNNTLTSGTLSTNNRLCTKFAGFKNGNYNLTFYINDSGNKQNTTSKTFLMNDLTPPIIIFNSSADVSVTYNSAVIRWSTNEYVNGSIRYG